MRSKSRKQTGRAGDKETARAGEAGQSIGEKLNRTPTCRHAKAQPRPKTWHATNVRQSPDFRMRNVEHWHSSRNISSISPISSIVFLCCPPIYGHRSTHCWVPASSVDRLATTYQSCPLTALGVCALPHCKPEFFSSSFLLSCLYTL